MSSLTRATVRSLAASRPLSRLRSIEERAGIVLFSLMFLFAMSHELWAHDFKVGEIEIEHPWSRATPAGAEVAAGYLILKNRGAEADRLVAVTAEIAGKAEVHEMAVDGNGVMTMREISGGLEIPAGAEIELKPGGLHLMFMKLSRPAKEGESFKGSLTFEKAGAVEVEYVVGPAGKTMSHDHTN